MVGALELVHASCRVTSDLLLFKELAVGFLHMRHSHYHFVYQFVMTYCNSLDFPFVFLFPPTFKNTSPIGKRIITHPSLFCAINSFCRLVSDKRSNMTSNLILSSSEAPLTRRASPPKQKQSKSPRKSSSLPVETVDYLKAWMMSPEHIAHPYPTEPEKTKIMADTGIELKQLTNWFVNNRKRFWKPRVEAQLQQQQATAVVSKITVSPTTTTFIPSPSSGNQYNIAVDMTKPPQLPMTPPLEGNVVNTSAFVSLRRSGSPRAVSIGSSSFASDSDIVSLSNESVDDLSVVDEVDDDSLTVKRTETVDVHILRPTGSDPIPTIEDVSILTNVPSNRILETYENCALSYQFPLEGLNDKKKVSKSMLLCDIGVILLRYSLFSH